MRTARRAVAIAAASAVLALGGAHPEAAGDGHEPRAPQLAAEGCGAYNPGMPSCEYTATSNGGISGYAPQAGGWTVTIAREAEPAVVIRAGGGYQTYQCSIIRPGDTVRTTAEPGSFVAAGNPGICF